jgi:hypothetical protein
LATIAECQEDSDVYYQGRHTTRSGPCIIRALFAASPAILIGGATMAAAACLPTTATDAAFEQANTSTASTGSKGDSTMNSITTKDGVEIFYRDWGTGQPIVFSHG